MSAPGSGPDSDERRASTVVLGARRRLEQAHDLWHAAVAAYRDADDFCLAVNALIPALRSTTFLLQKELRRSDGFDAWYGSKQTEMAADPVMRWIVEARNHIEKQGDLEMRSTARVTIMTGWLSQPYQEFDVPPIVPAAVIAADLAGRDYPDRVRREGLVRVDRRWVTASLPDLELLDACSHGWHVLDRIIAEAERLFRGSTEPQFAAFARRPCMVVRAEDRSATFHLASMELVGHEIVSRAPSPEVLATAEVRFGAGLAAIARPEDDLRDRVRWYHEQARLFLSVEGNAASVAFVRRQGELLRMIGMEPEDQPDKWLLMERLAALVATLGADEVVITNEVWWASPVPADDPRFGLRAGEREDRGEALQTVGANVDGLIFDAVTPFTRVDGEVVLDSAAYGSPAVALFLGPILAVWGLDPLRGGRIVEDGQMPSK